MAQSRQARSRLGRQLLTQIGNPSSQPVNLQRFSLPRTAKSPRELRKPCCDMRRGDVGRGTKRTRKLRVLSRVKRRQWFGAFLASHLRWFARYNFNRENLEQRGQPPIYPYSSCVSGG